MGPTAYIVNEGVTTMKQVVLGRVFVLCGILGLGLAACGDQAETEQQAAPAAPELSIEELIREYESEHPTPTPYEFGDPCSLSAITCTDEGLVVELQRRSL